MICLLLWLKSNRGSVSFGVFIYHMTRRTNGIAAVVKCNNQNLSFPDKFGEGKQYLVYVSRDQVKWLNGGFKSKGNAETVETILKW